MSIPDCRQDLSRRMQNPAVQAYADILQKRRLSLLWKRVLEWAAALIVFLITLPVFALISLLVKCTSPGPVFFKQERIGKNGRPFFILKFRTMQAGADRAGVQLTTGDDRRITRFGALLRKTNLDEMPQLLHVLSGKMSVVGTRPEVRRYVERYTDEMMATLLLPPGMLSDASVKYKEESSLLSSSDNPEQVYLTQILPAKMRFNLAYLPRAGVLADIKIIGRSIACLFKKGNSN